ncbi:MAG TPA: hypothetical protein VHG09_12525 [Longimicrobiales bacterium]|nr:hypothetical protein [Longimicrobiales bacterium]
MHSKTRIPDLRTIVMAALVAVTAGCAGDDAASDESDASAAAAPLSQPSIAGAGDDADIAEIQDYEFTMDDLHRWSEATVALQRLAESNPQLGAAFEQEESGNQDLDDSIDMMTERIENVPEATDVIEDAGLSPREYVVIFWAMLQTGMAQFSIAQGANPDEVAREMRVNPANLEFMKEHEAEIAEMRRTMNGGS